MRRILLLTLALSIAAFAAVPTADAASSKRCKAAATKAKAKVIKKGKTSLVARRGKDSEIGARYYSCFYASPKLFKFSNQFAGDTDFYNGFRLNGRYLVYAHQNVEEAATEFPSWVEVVDVKRRKRLHQFDAFPGADSSGVLQILLRRDGAIAWIGTDEVSDPNRRSVQTALVTQNAPVEVDRGTAIGSKSLRRVPNDASRFAWTNGGVTNTAVFGG